MAKGGSAVCTISSVRAGVLPFWCLGGMWDAACGAFSGSTNKPGLPSHAHTYTSHGEERRNHQGRKEVRAHWTVMGEPLIGSLVCGSIALSMMLWNWRIHEHQKHLRKICARQAAMKAQETARLREQSRAEAVAAAAAAAVADEDCKEAKRVSAAASSKSPTSSSSFRKVIKLESLPELSETSEDRELASPLVLVKPRERLETAPMSPPLSSTRSRSGTGCFFTDG